MEKFFRGILKTAGTTILIVVTAVLITAGLELGYKTVRYAQRGFSVQDAVIWAGEDLTADIDKLVGVRLELDDHMKEREILYTVNRYVDIKPCVNLGKR